MQGAGSSVSWISHRTYSIFMKFQHMTAIWECRIDPVPPPRRRSLRKEMDLKINPQITEARPAKVQQFFERNRTFRWIILVFSL